MTCDPFDATLAQGRVRRVSSAEVIDLLRITHAPEMIARYRKSMEQGDRFPPVSVLLIAGRLVLADGHKRLLACRSLGVEEISVEVWTLARWLRDQRRQLANNVRKNRKILRLSFSNPREAARTALSTFQHWMRVARSLVSFFLPRSRHQVTGASVRPRRSSRIRSGDRDGSSME